jgi:hypothetical protein
MPAKPGKTQQCHPPDTLQGIMDTMGAALQRTSQSGVEVGLLCLVWNSLPDPSTTPCQLAASASQLPHTRPVLVALHGAWEGADVRGAPSCRGWLRGRHASPCAGGGLAHGGSAPNAHAGLGTHLQTSWPPWSYGPPMQQPRHALGRAAREGWSLGAPHGHHHVHAALESPPLIRLRGWLHMPSMHLLARQ